jgi:hypothetical protein
MSYTLSTVLAAQGTPWSSSEDTTAAAALIGAMNPDIQQDCMIDATYPQLTRNLPPTHPLLSPFPLQVCSEAYGLAPEVVVSGDRFARLPYLTAHLDYMIYELLKNSMRAGGGGDFSRWGGGGGGREVGSICMCVLMYGCQQ